MDDDVSWSDAVTGQADSRDDDAGTAPSVPAALRRLEGLEQRPVEQHADRYEAVHADLLTALGDAEPTAGTVAGPREHTTGPPAQATAPTGRTTAPTGPTE